MHKKGNEWLTPSLFLGLLLEKRGGWLCLPIGTGVFQSAQMAMQPYLKVHKILDDVQGQNNKQICTTMVEEFYTRSKTFVFIANGQKY